MLNPASRAVADVMDDAAVDIEARLRQELTSIIRVVVDLRTLEMEALAGESLRRSVRVFCESECNCRGDHR